MPDTWSGSLGWRITVPVQPPVPVRSWAPVAAAQRRIILPVPQPSPITAAARQRRGHGASQAVSAYRPSPGS